MPHKDAHGDTLVYARTAYAFIALREALDATLPLPHRVLHALQGNIDAGPNAMRKGGGISSSRSVR